MPSNPNRQNKAPTDLSEQGVLNKSFDNEFNVLAVENLVFNPATNTLDRFSGDSISYATRIDDTTTPNTTYLGKAPIGSVTSSAVWQIAKLDTSSGLIKTWADASSSFNQVWNNRAGLTYA